MIAPLCHRCPRGLLQMDDDDFSEGNDDGEDDEDGDDCDEDEAM